MTGEYMATTNDPYTGLQNQGMTPSSGEGVRDRFNDATKHMKETASDFGRSAKENIDRNLKNAAGALENTASAIRSKLPDDRSGKMTGVAQTAVDKLDATAQYLRTHDTNDMMSGLESWARRNPGAALSGALAVGFFLGMSLSRDRRRY
jgi:ElaB/YqjD/DUF883 family membrane-anchored ribosome-binding protein